LVGQPPDETATRPPPMITVEHLTKHYRVHDKQPGFVGSLKAFVRRRTYAVEAVKDVSFTIEAGEVVGFLGPNGAGKTTTLKMLAGPAAQRWPASRRRSASGRS
jgi:ABC-2 type transport system ATP-binding protein